MSVMWHHAMLQLSREPSLRTASGHWLFPPVVWVESESHPSVNPSVTLGTGILTLTILHSYTQNAAASVVTSAPPSDLRPCCTKPTAVYPHSCAFSAATACPGSSPCSIAATPAPSPTLEALQSSPSKQPRTIIVAHYHF